MKRAVQRSLGLLFVLSGFSAVAYQVLLSRYVQLISGVTAHAVSALLVAFLLGMAGGSYVGGRFADRVVRPLRVYAVAEGLVGLYALAFPLFFPFFQELYLGLSGGLDGSPLRRDVVRFGLGVAAFLGPSLLLGATTPAFARALTGGRRGAGEQLVRLYGWNTLGAALGALATAYFTVPLVGVRGGMALMAVGNAIVCVLAWWAAEPLPPSGGAVPSAEAASRAMQSDDGWERAALLLAFGTGLASFALEVVWTHLLAVLIGNSVYAFGLMLGCLLLGLYAGSLLARPLARSGTAAAHGVGVTLCLAGVAVLATLFVWDDVPRVFLWLTTASPSFVMLETTRLVVALGLMGVPTAMLGVGFPLILSSASGRGVGGRVGTLYAVNTLGAVLGALGAPYLLLPRLGSLVTLRVLGSLLVVLGVLALATLGRDTASRVFAVVALAAPAFAWLLPVQWDLGQLSSASSIYLGRSESSQSSIAFVREHPTGGLVTVLSRNGVKTLLTNGKFEGDDADEVAIQHRLAHIPPLFTAGRERAIVLGLGTGVTLNALAAHGFRETLCAEISRPIVEAAREQFAHVNGNVLDRPDVRLLPEDGRSVLAESPARYDVVSVEVSTIWFAGVGNIYSREFYSLASSRLRHGGVLLQWFPLHHLSVRNLYVVVNTIRSVFPHVSVWTHRHQGFVVASLEPLALDVASVRADLERPEMKPFLKDFQTGSPFELLSDLAVGDGDVDGFLDSLAQLLYTTRDEVSTDSWPTLEYETPRDILAHFSYFQNRGLLARFRSLSPPPFRGEPSAPERALARAAFGRGWGDADASLLASAWTERGGDASLALWALDPLVLGNGRPRAAAAVGDLFALAGGAVGCAPERDVLSAPAIPLTVSGSVGKWAFGSSPAGLADGNVSPDFGRGTWASADGDRPIAIELDAAGARVSAVDVAFEPPRGEDVTVRVLGRGLDERWRPIGTARVATGDCSSWRFGLGRPTPLRGIHVSFEPESSRAQLGLFEIRAEP